MFKTSRARRAREDDLEPGTDRSLGAPSGFATRIALWSATHRKTALLLWLLAIAVAIVVGGSQAPREATPADQSVGQSHTAAVMAENAGFVDPALENVLITARSGNLDKAAATAAATDIRSSLTTTKDVTSVTAPVPSDDGRAVLVRAAISGDSATADERIAPMQQVVKTAAAKYPNLRIEQVGNASINQELNEWLNKDLEKATLLSVPMTLVILLIVFGAMVMAGVPVILGLASVAAALGLWGLVSQVTPDPGTAMHLIVLVGMAVGVDYSLFYLRRYREQRHAGDGKIDSIQIAAQTAGHSVVVSAVAVMLSMAGLYLAGDAFSLAMASGAILVVVVALVSSLTALPALLVSLDRFVDRPRVPVLWRIANSSSEPRILPAIMTPVLRHPRAWLAACVLVLIGLSVPLTGMSLKNTQAEDVPRSLSSIQTYDRMVAAFPDTTSTDRIVVKVPADQTAQLRTQATGPLTKALSAHGDLYDGVAKSWTSPDGRTAVIDVATPYAVASSGGQKSVNTLRDNVVNEVFGKIPGAETAVGGYIAEDMDFTNQTSESLPIVIAAVFALIFLIMFLAYRSLAIAGITVALNALSVGAAFGILTLVFQSSWAESLLGFTSTGHIVTWVPTLLFVVLCGLSLDYHVFVVSRIRENAMAGMPTKRAIHDGVVRTAGVVTSAALVMVGVFSIFGMLSFVQLKQIGLGLAVGIVIDATLIRVIALPAAMALFGRFLWSPSKAVAGKEDSRLAAAAEVHPVDSPAVLQPARVGDLVDSF